MQKKVIDWLYNLQSRWGILKEEERSLYEYAYRLLLSRILIYSIIIALGIITGNWLEMFSFLLPFVILRQYVGGIHLKRSVSCICVSGFLIFICGKYLCHILLLHRCRYRTFLCLSGYSKGYNVLFQHTCPWHGALPHG